MPQADLHRVVKCRPESGYRLWLRFADGLEGKVYLGNLLELGVFKLWRDVREFQKVSAIEGITIWDCGIRLDSEVLYQDVLAKKLAAPVKRETKKLPQNPEIPLRSFEATQSLNALKPIRHQLEGCQGLVGQAIADIDKKIERISSAHEIRRADPDLQERLQESARELRASSTLGRAIEDLETASGNMLTLVHSLRTMSEGS